MAGHSKWNNIKNHKAAVDAKKGKIFSQISKNIRVAVKEGKSGDPKTNPSLRLQLEKARAANMPNTKVKKAIDAGLGKGDNGVIKELVYEGFGPGGVALVVVGLTDNANRTSAEIKYIFSRGDGTLGSPGSVMYMFSRSKDGEYTSTMPIQIEDEEQQEKLQNIIDQFRENEDVEDVYCAGEWPEKS